VPSVTNRLLVIVTGAKEDVPIFRQWQIKLSIIRTKVDFTTSLNSLK